MFETPHEVVSALKRYRDVFDPRSGSIIAPSKAGLDPRADPFRAGFLSGIDERQELARRLTTRLAARERLLLVLWYVADLPVPRIARRIGVSRVHCYRLRAEAVRALCDDPESQPAAHRPEPAYEPLRRAGR